MNDLFRRNLDVLERKHPKLFQALQSEIKKFEEFPTGTENEKFEWLENDRGDRNLVYFRNDPKAHVIYHELDPWREAVEVVQTADVKHAQCILNFGIGLGYVLKTFLRVRPEKCFAILVFEKNPQVFLRALSVHDWAKEFEDESISWSVSTRSEDHRSTLNSFFTINTTINRLFKILATPRALELDGEFYEFLARGTLEVRDHTTVQVGNSVSDSMRGLSQTITNFDRAIANTGICSLLNQFKGKLCISVAAGPSVNENWDLLKKVQGKIPIIACDSALKPMHERGVVPDFVTALERDDYVPTLFHGIPISERTSLVAPTLILKDTFEAFHGHQIIYAPGLAYINVLGLNFLGPFHPGSSAGNLNIALAAFMGFSQVIMIGHNLAFGYKTHETHMRGTIDPDRERSRSDDELLRESRGAKTITQDGTDEVWTKFEWNLFRSQMEAAVTDHPGTTFINTAFKGARIFGTKTMSFQDALDQYYKEDFDISPIKKQLLIDPAEQTIKERKRSAIEGAERALESILKWRTKGQLILEKLNGWKTEIEAKEKENSPFDLDYLNRAIDEVLDVKVNAVNEDLSFYHSAISILFPAHIAFEREINQIFPKYTSDYELKRDFLLRHIRYFEIWEEWLPKIQDAYSDFLRQYAVGSSRNKTKTEPPEAAIADN